MFLTLIPLIQIFIIYNTYLEYGWRVEIKDFDYYFLK